MTVATLDPDRCPNCGDDLHHLGWEQPALLRHAGYGATERTRIRVCRCGWWLTVERGEVRPRDTRCEP